MKVLAIVGVAAAVVFCGIADAGMKNTSETVVIYGNSLRVRGSMGGTRSSSNTKEVIGCKVIADTGGLLVSCFAQDSAGTQWSCDSTDANMVKAASAISGASYVTLNRDKTNASKCTYIAVDNSSAHQPMVP